MEQTGLNVDWMRLCIGLLGGLALFLYGMEQLSNGLKSAAGDRMKSLLGKFTRNRFLGAATGAGVTAVIQSSSVTSVLTVGFVAAGLMTLPQALSVIIGANIGTTITAQIIAFKVTTLALPLVTFGTLLILAMKSDRGRYMGKIILGLGLVFYGLSLMSEAMYPLREHQGFIALMARADHALIGLAVGALVTALLQSSSATTGLIIMLASSGLISLPAGIALAIGANVGTCVTAMLAAIGKSRAALQVACSHVLFNLAGGVLWIGLTGFLADVAGMMSPGGDIARQIAMAHTAFNVANAVLFIGFIGPVSHILQKWLPEQAKAGKVTAIYLQDDLFAAPSLALEAARMEVVRLGEHVRAMLLEAYPAIIAGHSAALRDLARQDEQVNALHDKILEYLRQLGRLPLDAHEGRALFALIEAVNHLEHIGDVIKSGLINRYGKRHAQRGFKTSSKTASLLNRLHREVVQSLDHLLTSLRDADPVAAKLVVKGKPAILTAAKAALERERQRLLSDDPDRIEVFNRETELVEQLRRIYGFVRQIGKAELARYKDKRKDLDVEPYVE